MVQCYVLRFIENNCSFCHKNRNEIMLTFLEVEYNINNFFTDLDYMKTEINFMCIAMKIRILDVKLKLIF